MPRQEENDLGSPSCCVQQVCNYESMHAAMCGLSFPFALLSQASGLRASPSSDPTRTRGAGVAA